MVFLVFFTYRFVVIYECECESPQTSKASWTPLFASGWYWVSRPILCHAWGKKLVLKCASSLCQPPAAGRALHMPPTDDSQHPESLCFARSGAWDKSSCLHWGIKTMSGPFHADYWPEGKFYFVRESNLASLRELGSLQRHQAKSSLNRWALALPAVAGRS